MTTPPLHPESHENNDWLDDLLQEEPAYIDDAGFTANLVAQLSHSSRSLIWKRRLILGTSILLSMLIAPFVLSSNAEIAHVLRNPSFSAFISLNALLIALGGFAAFFISSSLFVVSREK